MAAETRNTQRRWRPEMRTTNTIEAKAGRRLASNKPETRRKVQGNEPQKIIIFVQYPKARPKGEGQNKSTHKAEDHQKKRCRPSGMPFPAQQARRGTKEFRRRKRRRSESGKAADPGKASGRKYLLLFPSQVLVTVLARLHRALQICWQEARFSRACQSIDPRSRAAGRPRTRPRESE